MEYTDVDKFDDDLLDREVVRVLEESIREQKKELSGARGRASRKKGFKGAVRTPYDLMTRQEKREYAKGGKVKVTSLLDDIKNVPPLADIEAKGYDEAKKVIEYLLTKHSQVMLIEHWDIDHNHMYRKVIKKYHIERPARNEMQDPIPRRRRTMDTNIRTNEHHDNTDDTTHKRTNVTFAMLKNVIPRKSEIDALGKEDGRKFLLDLLNEYAASQISTRWGMNKEKFKRYMTSYDIDESFFKTSEQIKEAKLLAGIVEDKVRDSKSANEDGIDFSVTGELVSVPKPKSTVVVEPRFDPRDFPIEVISKSTARPAETIITPTTPSAYIATPAPKVEPKDESVDDVDSLWRAKLAGNMTKDYLVKKLNGIIASLDDDKTYEVKFLISEVAKK